jgi:hypothetical protein
MTNNNDKITLPQQVVSEENAHPSSENQAFEECLEVALRDDNMCWASDEKTHSLLVKERRSQ